MAQLLICLLQEDMLGLSPHTVFDAAAESFHAALKSTNLHQTLREIFLGTESNEMLLCLEQHFNVGTNQVLRELLQRFAPSDSVGPVSETRVDFAHQVGFAAGNVRKLILAAGSRKLLEQPRANANPPLLLSFGEGAQSMPVTSTLPSPLTIPLSAPPSLLSPSFHQSIKLPIPLLPPSQGTSKST
jgi:hypothetical protein